MHARSAYFPYLNGFFETDNIRDARKGKKKRERERQRDKERDRETEKEREKRILNLIRNNFEAGARAV